MPLLVLAPKDPAVRSDLLYGAYLAGSVLATVGVGVHHRTCHVLGGSYGLAHASCNAVILPHAIAYNAPVIPGVLARVGAALSPEPVAREDVAGFTFDLIVGLGLPTSLEALGLPEPMLDAAAHRIVSETPSNPRRMDFATVRAMLDDAWHGRRP